MVNIVYKNAVSESLPTTLIIGELSNLRKIQFDDVKPALGNKVSEKVSRVWYRKNSSLLILRASHVLNTILGMHIFSVT